MKSSALIILTLIEVTHLKVHHVDDILQPEVPASVTISRNSGTSGTSMPSICFFIMCVAKPGHPGKTHQQVGHVGRRVSHRSELEVLHGLLVDHVEAPEIEEMNLEPSPSAALASTSPG